MENPADAFSAGFNRASDKVDTVFSPSKWGKSSSASGPVSSKTKSPRPAKSGLPIESYQQRDAEAIMQAVVNGDVSTLSRQQQELAAELLRKLQRS